VVVFFLQLVAAVSALGVHNDLLLQAVLVLVAARASSVGW
jgi:hypothetical protein